MLRAVGQVLQAADVVAVAVVDRFSDLGISIPLSIGGRAATVLGGFSQRPAVDAGRDVRGFLDVGVADAP
jgi:hypothetical protein